MGEGSGLTAKCSAQFIYAAANISANPLERQKGKEAEAEVPTFASGAPDNLV
ncbi:hypothetical protein [Kalamiella sp. sgz302252]|uniref:hypothetical protein n=1 Tax=Pantoea sp. sgz302252 TaxID=3341827 RepID=UPI0036D3CE7A